MKSFSILCSYVAGLAFVISGFLKLLDPVGTGFIMEEYFKFLHLGFLSGVSVAAGIVMSALEFILGGLMIVRFKMAFTSVAVLVLMGFYLILTLLLAVFNPPMDCGCFGEAVHLTHLQTLIKNTVLSLIWGLPLLLEYAQTGWMAECGTEELGGGTALRVDCRDPEKAPGEGRTCTLWFDPGTHALLRGELAQDGFTVLRCEFEAFETW